jgi:hypothetical protein
MLSPCFWEIFPDEWDWWSHGLSLFFDQPCLFGTSPVFGQTLKNHMIGCTLSPIDSFCLHDIPLRCLALCPHISLTGQLLNHVKPVFWINLVHIFFASQFLHYLLWLGVFPQIWSMFFAGFVPHRRGRGAAAQNFWCARFQAVPSHEGEAWWNAGNGEILPMNMAMVARWWSTDFKG